MTKEEHTRISDSALNVGMLYGFLSAPDIRAYLNERDVTDADIKKMQKAVEGVANGFYRDR